MLPNTPSSSTAPAQPVALNVVPAAAGKAWVKQGIQTFFKQPLALGGLFFMFLAVVSIISIVPMIGGALALIVLPAATVGLMEATKQADAGTFPMPSTLFTAFKINPAKTRNILLLGVGYAASFLLVLGISALLDGGQFAQMYLSGEVVSKQVLETTEFQMATWVSMVLYVPISMMFWHSPALVHWHDVPPLKALFFSWMACIRNLTAMMVFVLSWIAVFLLGGTAMALVAGLTGSESMVSMVMLPVALLMATMFFCSIYFSVRDCFKPLNDGHPDTPVA
ncbi:MAG TPA: BPSS1780 family membrane protein [Burkholderiaceae bacterium]|nr:BPSS1780 family membrane protein [Burkholderiaceae bacterium]